LVTDSQVGAVQVVDESGTVLAASNGAPPSPLAATTLRDGQTRNVGRVEDPGGQFDYWVSARAAAVPGGIVTILVGTDREPVESVITKVAALLAVGSPLIIVLVVVGTYRLVGAALGPVEAIRAQVAQIVRSHGGTSQSATQPPAERYSPSLCHWHSRIRSARLTAARR
jgi:hypothetical protein